MKMRISEILEQAGKAKTDQEKIDILRKYQSSALLNIIAYALDPRLVWLLPKGNPPYKPSPYLDQDAMMYTEAKRLYLFVDGGNPKLTPLRREQLFVQLLESLAPQDAEMLLAVKEKKLPYKGLNKKLINKAFPGLIPDEQVVQEAQ